MAFTMMATAGAAYTDQADIQATEAVEMLNALGVMTGDPDGSFRPNDTITRAEACRMIYTIRTNSDDASAYADMQTTFKDVPADAWYAGYVKHCQAANIVSGTSATTFEPNREVTGVELALMCLRVMGYDPAKADIGGSTWSTKTISLSTEAGILDGVNTTITSACPRQWAAQIMYNTIEAPTVQWSTDTNSYSKYFDDGKERDSVGKEYLKLWIDIGTLTSVDDDNLTIYSNSSDAEDSDNSYVGNHDFTKVANDYSSLLGHKVKVLYRDGKTNAVIGVYPLEDNTSYTVNMKDIEKDGDKVKFDGKSYGFDDATLRVEVLDVDGKVTTSDVKSTYFDVEANSNANAVAEKTVTFVDNDGDGKLNIAFVTEYASAEVTYVGSDRITADKTYKMEDHNISEDLAKDDFAMISWNRFDDCKDIAKADVVVDTLASSKDKGNYQQYKIGETWYNIAENATSGWDNVTVGDTVKAYIVAGVIVDIDTDDGTGAIPTNIAVVVGLGDNSLNGDQAKLRYFDGTLKTVTLDKTVKADGTTTKAVKGFAYKVSGSDNSTRLEELKGQKYNGYEYITKTYGTGEAVTASNSKLNSISGKVVDDNATVILYNPNDGSSKKITGKQFKAIDSGNSDLLADMSKAGTAAFTKKVNGVERVLLAAVEVKDTDITGTSYDNYGYVTSDGAKVSNGDVEFTMWNGSENLNVKVESGSEDDYTKGTLVAYSAIDNDYLQDAEAFGTIEDLSKMSKPATAADLYVAANLADSATVVTDGNKVLNVTSSTHVLVVDSDADKADEIGIPYTAGNNLKTATLKEVTQSGEVYRLNMVYRVDGGGTSADDDDLDLLVIDNTGAFDFNKPESGSAGSGNGGSTSKGDFTFTTTDKTVLEVKTADIQADGNVIFTVNVLGNATAANTTFDWEVFVNDIPVAKGDDVAANASNYQTTGVQVKDGAKVTIALSDIKVEGLSNPSADDINNAFEQEGVTNVTVSGDVTGAVKVPEGKKLTLDDKAVLKDATVEGSVVVGDIDVSGDVDLSKADVASIEKVDVLNGASLNVTAGSIKDLTAGTLNVNAGGALKVADKNSDSSATLVGPDTAEARIQTAADTTVSLDLANGAMTIAGDAEIPAGQTWYSMLGPLAAEAEGLVMELTTGTLTVNGTLKLVSAGSSSFKVSGDAKVVVGATGVINVAAKASLDGNNAITGTEGSQLNVTNGSGTISNVAGVSDHSEGNYTWSTDKWTTGA
ncbi:S-layer homology domain-containing protein [Intestinibacillus sp. Marseille-P6563]|uniref:S-layer homology domain-containing protein n=1 Tax=Intestinibacillus sp. Marseille-P6563 TaxID=2364792 RepID=UPI000F070527|nr:S-layer homology domain-containing protein [Intestinibacillus sp. Marseille-P6563]